MRNNKEKAITIAALVIAVIGLSIGFAAFASTLNISTSASVTPADGNFIVKFSKVNNELNEEDVTPSTGTGDAADIDNTNASNPKIGTLSTTFTQPGQSVEYTFYVRNMGKYDAYLTNIRFNNASTGNSFKVCTATSDNPVSNANDMCKYITYRLTLEDSPSNKILTSTSDFAQAVGSSYYVPKSSTPNSGTTNSKMVKVTITYEDGSPFADGAFTVDFGSVELVFASLAGYVPQVPVATAEEQEEIYVGNLEPTQQQLASADADLNNGIYTFAGVKGVDAVMYMFNESEQINMVEIMHNGVLYDWFCNSTIASLYEPYMGGISVEENKWYYSTDGETYSLYNTDASPIDLETFTPVYNEEYLKRVIASFGS